MTQALPRIGDAISETLTGAVGEVVGIGVDWIAVRTRDMTWERWFLQRWYDDVVPHHCLFCGALHDSPHAPYCQDKDVRWFGMGEQ